MITTEDILYVIGFSAVLLFSSSFKDEALNKCLRNGSIDTGKEIVICRKVEYK